MRNSSLCVRVWYLSEGKDRLHEAWRVIATIEHSRLEVEWHKHGLYCRFTYDGPQVRFDLSDHGLVHQIGSFYTRQHSVWCSEVCWDICYPCAMLAWSSLRKLELWWATTLGRDASPWAWVGAAPGRSQPPQLSDRWWAVEIRSRDTDSIGLIWAVDPVANGRWLMKFVDLWAGVGGPGPQCCGHILQIFLKENNSINPGNRWNLRIL
jgi:hypothetical protein